MKYTPIISFASSQCLSVFLYRELQSMVDDELEEFNQYYLSAELMDDVKTNIANIQAELKREPRKFQSFKKYLSQDNYLTNLTEELNHAIFACIQHHQILIEFSAMMEDFFSVFVLLKSFQCTFQICNLVFIFLKVSMNGRMAKKRKIKSISPKSYLLDNFTYAVA